MPSVEWMDRNLMELELPLNLLIGVKGAVLRVEKRDIGRGTVARLCVAEAVVVQEEDPAVTCAEN